MPLDIRKFSLVVILLAAAVPARAQTKFPPGTRNAALRYWIAFADLQDLPADAATQDLLEKTAAGEAPWDESRLGPILDQNQAAIDGMQRATKLPECDWGLEYTRGPFASIAYVPRARVLARLNTLYGMRQMSKGDSQRAVETWLDGIRFSQHVAQGGTLIFQLIAKMAMLSNFRALTNAAESRQLTNEEKEQVLSAVHALPSDGFDWANALALEEAALEIAVQKMAQSGSPAAFYKEMMGRDAPLNLSVPTAKDIADSRALFADAQAALRLSTAQARERLRSIQARVNSLHPFFRETIPGLTKINDARADIEAARQKLIAALR